MPVAHVCPLCGNQLARTRALLDAAYSLPIVRCDCGFVAVRRRHPVAVRSRRVLPILSAIVRLILQLLLIPFFSIVTALCIRGLSDDIRSFRHTPLSFASALLFHARDNERLVQSWGIDRGGFLSLTGFAVLGLVVGIWLRLSYPHWRWPRHALAWIVMVSVVLWSNVLFWPLIWTLHKFTGEHTPLSGPTVSQSFSYMQIFAASLFVTLVGTQIGYALTKLGPPLQRGLFKRRRNKLRKRRNAE